MLWITLGVIVTPAALLLMSAVWLGPPAKGIRRPVHHQCALPPPPQDLHLLRLEGDGEYSLEVDGGSERHEALERLCGPGCEADHNRKAVAILVPDLGAGERTCGVAVMIDGERVGYLAPEAVDRYQDETAREGWRGLAAICDARIEDGHVRLDVRWPLSGRVNEYRRVA